MKILADGPRCNSNKGAVSRPLDIVGIQFRDRFGRMISGNFMPRKLLHSRIGMGKRVLWARK